MREAGKLESGWEAGTMGWEKEAGARSSCLHHFFPLSDEDRSPEL